MLRKAVCFIAFLGVPLVLAASPVYTDDRSTPAGVVQSFYNAINRAEYLRAWSYFKSAAAPAYASFKSGYGDTLSVEVKLGKPRSEGAAGSVQTKLPVALLAHHADGSSSLFEGCYTLIQIDPSIQDAPPFRPIEITSAHLTASSGSLGSATPSCD